MEIDDNLAIFVNRKKKATTRAELEKFTKDVSVVWPVRGLVQLFVYPSLAQELIDRVIQLETHNQQLKNIIKKELVNSVPDDDEADSAKQRKFDFKK